MPGSFNPLWVFQCAATGSHQARAIIIIMFQSLMGFPMRCDLKAYGVRPPNGFVSIPYGFSNALRPSGSGSAMDTDASFNPLWVFQCAATNHKLCMLLLLLLVSIPYGFSNALRPHTVLTAPVPTSRFNPLWVFQCAAT